MGHVLKIRGQEGVQDRHREDNRGDNLQGGGDHDEPLLKIQWIPYRPNCGIPLSITPLEQA